MTSTRTVTITVENKKPISPCSCSICQYCHHSQDALAKKTQGPYPHISQSKGMQLRPVVLLEPPSPCTRPDSWNSKTKTQGHDIHVRWPCAQPKQPRCTMTIPCQTEKGNERRQTATTAGFGPVKRARNTCAGEINQTWSGRQVSTCEGGWRITRPNGQ